MKTRVCSLMLTLIAGLAMSTAHAQPVPPAVPGTAPAEPPAPAFDTLPEAVRKGAQAYDARLTKFHTDFANKSGSVMMYRIFATGPKLEVTMTIAESGRVLTAIVEDSDNIKAPRELIDAIKTRASAGQIVTITRYTEDYNEYRDWLDITAPTPQVRRASIDAAIGILFNQMSPEKLEMTLRGEVLDVRDEESKVKGRADFDALPEAVRTIVSSQSDQLTDYVVDQKSADFVTVRAMGKGTDVTVEALRSGTLLHLNREVPAKAGDAPPELAKVSAEFYPASTVKAHTYVHDLRIEYRAVVRDGGKRYVGVMRSNGSIEFVADVAKPARPGR